MPVDPAAHRRPPARCRSFAAVALLTLLVLAVALSACGGSGSSSGSTNSASTTKAGGARSNRFAAMQSCLQKEGIVLPAPSSKAPGRPGGGGFPRGRGGFKLPEGTSRSKFLEAIKKCGGGHFSGRARPGFDSATARAALAKYAKCMSENGVKLPTPNTSGKGPVFDTRGVDTSSQAFKAAQEKCQSDLHGAFGAGGPSGGGPPSAGGEGGPPAGGTVPPAGGYGPPPGAEAEGG